MSYWHSRDQGRGVCVCSLQLWIISTLFLLWPTCTERRTCPHEPLFLSHFQSEAAGCMWWWWWWSPYGKPYVNFKSSAGNDQGHGRHPPFGFPLNVQLMWSCAAEPPPQWLRRLLRVCRQISPPPLSYSLWRRFFWSPWKAPIGSSLHSLWNRFSPFCSYSLCGCHGYHSQVSCAWICLWALTWSRLHSSLFVFTAKVNTIY